MLEMTAIVLIGFALIGFALIGLRVWHYRDFKRRHDVPLFLTHMPDGFPVGSMHEGHRITRLVRQAPTALLAGCVAPCWQVYGTLSL